MLTVKWIASNGAEMIYSAKDVSYTPAEALSPSAMLSGSTGVPGVTRVLVARDMRKPTVSFYIVPGDVHCTIDSGRVYVMNDNGKTVADYFLETPEFLHGVAPHHAA